MAIVLKQLTHSLAVTWTFKNGDFDFKTAVRYMYENIFDVAPEYRRIKEFDILGIL